MRLIAPGYPTNILTCPGFVTIVYLIAIIIEKLPNTLIPKLLDWSIHILLVYVIWLYSLSNIYTFNLRNHQHDLFKVFATDTLQEARALKDFNPELPWMFSYFYELPTFNNGIANGFMTEEGISWNSFRGVKRYHMFYQKYLDFNFSHVDEEKYKEIINTEAFKSMPTYPNKGSVKIINNTVVVKTSENIFPLQNKGQ